MLVFPVFDISELDQEKFPLVPISHNPLSPSEERAQVRNFEMTCYYVAPIFARTVARTIQCGTGGRSGISGQCGIRKSSFFLRF